MTTPSPPRVGEQGGSYLRKGKRSRERVAAADKYSLGSVSPFKRLCARTLAISLSLPPSVLLEGSPLHRLSHPPPLPAKYRVDPGLANLLGSLNCGSASRASCLLSLLGHAFPHPLPSLLSPSPSPLLNYYIISFIWGEVTE